MNKRVVIDCNSMVLRRGMTHLAGIGRTTRDLLSALAGLGPLPFEVVMFTQRIRGRMPEGRLPFRNVNFPMFSGPVSDALMQKYPILDMAVRHDVLHIPHNYAPVHRPEKTLVTIHDTLFFSYPEQFLGHDFAISHYPRIAKSCKAIITCSRNSKDDIVHYMGIPPEKVTVALWGVNREVFFMVDKAAARSALAAELGLDRPFYVSVSCDIGRKNTITLLQAYRIALKRGLEHDLVLVWGNPPAEYLNEFASEINAGRIHFVAHVDDTLLRQLYGASTVSWFPSRYEGFGLPVLESMACGTPVVTCRNSSLSEVGGDAALYIEPDDVDAMAELMITFDRGFSRYDELVERSYRHAARFTWEKTARTYVDFYLENM